MRLDRGRQEILLVLALTFGLSGVRSILNLISSLAAPENLNAQQVTLNATASRLPFIDLGLQLCSAAALFAYGALALYLLAGDKISLPRWRPRDGVLGVGLAAVIGIPGLAFYLAALHFGLSKEVVPTDFDNASVEVPVLLIKSFANAFAEEVVVVFWLITRLRQRKWTLPAALAASSILRGSYHLYQGISAGVGNIVMGVIYAYFFHKTGRVWPLIIGHFLIDAVAFLGYSFLGPLLSPYFGL
ncbi:MAG: CPBP family intramembrane metalloprotease [Corynebacterium flavescens]|uniref:CPBP family intramembrane glutamic endopeptidase n=1 Tax=Corynebacterium flavescens TaxID=28028 RepID=UPI002648C585|nr:CPBP family intramembrane glutamic endopeptidase [Corynebacterium flavescens]MDN6553202.1 CPBP family intramembrane metalloprotease [Corynebacterium flavescens]